MDMESIIMQLIAHSGEARTLAFEALKAAKRKDSEEAQRLLAKSKDELTEAHNAQTQLLFAEAGGEKPEFSILLVHAQDHFMTSMLAQELIEEMVSLVNAGGTGETLQAQD